MIGSSNFAASIIIDGLVTNNGSPVNAGQLINLTYSNRTDTIAFTNGSGRYTTTINPKVQSGFVEASFIDCAGDTIREVKTFDSLTTILTLDLAGCIPTSSIRLKGFITNLPNPYTPTYIVHSISGFGSVDSILIDSTGAYEKTINSSSQGMVTVKLRDCNSNILIDSAFFRSGDTITFNFDYCKSPPQPQYSGVVTFRNLPISNNNVFLLRYKYNPTEQLMEFVDTILVNALGAYSFPKNTNDEYLLKAMPSFDSAMFVATYYPKGLRWDDNNALALGPHLTNTQNLDIELAPKSPTASGQGSISGSVLVDASMQKAGYDGVGIHVFDASFNPVDYRFTSGSGSFEFNDLPHGEYTLWLDQCGLPTEPITVLISNESSTISDLKITVNSLGVSADNYVFVDPNAPTNSVAYPNPFSNEIHLTNYSGTVELYNSFGHLMVFHKFQLEEEHYKIDASEWPKGVYIIKTSTKNKELNQKLIKY